ncbi:MAG: hypothetical protein HYR85_04905 [Planctomycetes bacterium]|nr:hypothetical protein [Planctomycetota bacterium]
MQIRDVELHVIQIPLRAPFQHASHERRQTDAVIVAITSDSGERGFGEILPRPYLTGETIQSVLHDHGPTMARRWLGRRLEDSKDVVAAIEGDLRDAGRALATFTGFEMAALDVAGRAIGFDAGDVLGPTCSGSLEPGVVIGFEVPTDELVWHCTLVRLAGRRHVKVKIGCDDDVRRLEIISKTLGKTARLRVDANGTWSARVAIERLQAMQHIDIEFVEQPVPATDLAGMRLVRERTGLAVTADESVCTLDDAHRLIAERAADAFNIRLAKCGGFVASLALVRVARDAGIDCHLGTLVGETGILSRASEIFGSRVEGFDFLDGKGQSRFLLTEDVVETPSTSRTADGPASVTMTGLGVRVREDMLARFAVSPPLVFQHFGGVAA